LCQPFLPGALASTEPIRTKSAHPPRTRNPIAVQNPEAGSAAHPKVAPDGGLPWVALRTRNRIQHVRNVIKLCPKSVIASPNPRPKPSPTSFPESVLRCPLMVQTWPEFS